MMYIQVQTVMLGKDTDEVLQHSDIPDTAVVSVHCIMVTLLLEGLECCWVVHICQELAQHRHLNINLGLKRIHQWNSFFYIHNLRVDLRPSICGIMFSYLSIALEIGTAFDHSLVNLEIQNTVACTNVL